MRLELREVSFSYRSRAFNPVEVLRGFSLDVGEGELLGVLGDEGAGKSTLLQVLGALLRPDRGSVRFDGRDVWSVPRRLPGERARVGLAMQFPEEQFLGGTVGEELMVTASLAGRAIRVSPEEALRRVGLPPELFDRSPLTLSTGEARSVALAALLVHAPEAFLLDEPVAGLDESHSLCLRRLVLSLREEGKTIVIASHDPELITSIADRVVVL